MSKDLSAYNIFDLRDIAVKRVPRGLFEFVDRGTEDEVALRNNRAAFERIKLKTRVLTDVSKRNQEIELFGKKHGMPLGIGKLWAVAPRNLDLRVDILEKVIAPTLRSDGMSLVNSIRRTTHAIAPSGNRHKA